jgi:hypothetical protein
MSQDAIMVPLPHQRLLFSDWDRIAVYDLPEMQQVPEHDPSSAFRINPRHRFDLPDKASITWNRANVNFSEGLWNELTRGGERSVNFLGQRYIYMLRIPNRKDEVSRLERRPITRSTNGAGKAQAGCCSARLAVWVADRTPRTGILLQTAVFSDFMELPSKAQGLAQPLGSLFLPIEGYETVLDTAIDEVSGRLCVLMDDADEPGSQRLVVIELV